MRDWLIAFGLRVVAHGCTTSSSSGWAPGGARIVALAGPQFVSPDLAGFPGHPEPSTQVLCR